MQLWGQAEIDAAQVLIELALVEDLNGGQDLTCSALIEPDERAAVQVVARRHGVLAGEPLGRMVFAMLDPGVTWAAECQDGNILQPGSIVATVSGRLSSLLTGERTMLNFLTHLSGIASVTRTFVDAAAGTRAQILDTRKTLPGWRALQKYAVRCGGGTNHRMGLYDGVLIKDNHLAAWTEGRTIAEAVETARRRSPTGIGIEIEVDTLDQLADALCGRPEIVLLDNMSPAQLRAAVKLRDAQAPGVLLEASGGITLETVAEIARTGVERISIGGLTHSAPALDLAFDWKGRMAAV
ncbi:MAG TPA: carboxylating nicotinate-nucleotide diphosphorylase [Planctomycetaceae bacterium]|nr:carboxylating nicotinate-nucleotide diphosphorylase [Planctomycetaceae bacterium]